MKSTLGAASRCDPRGDAVPRAGKSFASRSGAASARDQDEYVIVVACEPRDQLVGDHDRVFEQ